MLEIQRGEIWWADLPERSEPGYRQPVLVVQADSFNRSRIQTPVVAVITGNIELAGPPGNILLPASSAGLPRDSVVNVSQLLTLDRTFLTEHAGRYRHGCSARSMKDSGPSYNSKQSEIMARSIMARLGVYSSK
jgi:mRNA interferase MazF